MKKYTKYLILVLAFCFLCACGKQSNVQKEEKESSKDLVIHTEEEKTEQLADAFTLEQKVGQLFIVRPDALNPSKEPSTGGIETTGMTELTSEMKENLQKYQIGGVCQFAKNIENPEQLLQFNQDLQSASEIPLFITVDEEGGVVARLANHEAFDLPQYESAADVNTNPDNPIIGTRAFSSNAETAASMVAAAAEGFRESGIIPTLKHFPGHGDTAEDSHTSLAVTHKTLEELQSCEFLPFEADTGMHAVMVGHIAAPEVTGNNLPATLCAEMIARIPDKDHTLIVTDSLEMQAISDQYSSGEAALQAFQAGCDVLLMPMDLQEAYETILEAVKDGRIREERLDESVNKILTYKQTFFDK